MTERERFARTFSHTEADRVPIIDSIWEGTNLRWLREGMPKNIHWTDYFDIDLAPHIHVDISPQYPYTVLEETKETITFTSRWGVTMRTLKQTDATPELLDYTVTDPASWEECKRRMYAGENRINWNMLKETFPRYRAEDRWITGDFWFGFNVTHSHMMGTENMLIAMYEEPDMVMDMFDTYLKRSIHLMNEVWDAGYHFDSVFWYDDMGYKGTAFFSVDMYRELLKPFHKRAVQWAHDRGIYAHLHSCGNIMTLVDDLVDIGIDVLNPIEIKAGMDPFLLKEKYGDKLVLHGGINAALWSDTEATLAEIRRIVPVLKQNGGYIFSSDHSIPSNVSLETYRQIVAEAKKLGTY